MTPSCKTLRPDVIHQLDQLTKLAAMGIEKRMYIFDEVSGDTLGLMQSAIQIYNVRPGSHPISFSFGHLTLQEFLAARYWSQLPSEKLTELVQRQDLFPLQQCLKGNYYYKLKQATHWPVLLFLAGLTQFTNIPTAHMTDPSSLSDKALSHSFSIVV